MLFCLDLNCQLRINISLLILVMSFVFAAELPPTLGKNGHLKPEPTAFIFNGT